MTRTPFVQVDVPLDGLRAGDRVPLGAAERHHLERVLRLGSGAPLEIADGAGGSAPAELAGADAVLTADACLTPPARPAVEVAQGLAKGRRVDEVVRAVTELGVDAILPVLTARSVPRLDADRAAKVVERWRAVARSACEQSRRPRRPRIHDVCRPADLAEDGVTVLVAHAGGTPLPRLVAGLADAAVVRVAIGPEGGFSPEEVAALTDRGARMVGLGPTVLRTEHAAVAAVAVLAAGLGRWEAGTPAPGAGR